MEMGAAANGESELIRMTVVDFFTRETLLDHLVKPTCRMAHFNTKYSGVTYQDMANAVRLRTCFFGRDAARKAFFDFVGPETIVIAHGGSSDLQTLRVIHELVVDTLILEGYFGVKTVGGRSLKNLTKLKNGWDIQVGNRGHDSLEDALAARELVVGFMGRMAGNL